MTTVAPPAGPGTRTGHELARLALTQITEVPETWTQSEWCGCWGAWVVEYDGLHVGEVSEMVADPVRDLAAGRTGPLHVEAWLSERLGIGWGAVEALTHYQNTLAMITAGVEAYVAGKYDDEIVAAVEGAR